MSEEVLNQLLHQHPDGLTRPKMRELSGLSYTEINLFLERNAILSRELACGTVFFADGTEQSNGILRSAPPQTHCWQKTNGQPESQQPVRPGRASKLVTSPDGISKPFLTWAKEFGIKPVTAHARRSYGWSDWECVSTPTIKAPGDRRGKSPKAGTDIQRKTRKAGARLKYS